MKRAEIHPSDWWAAQRLQYNLALVVAGVVAFIAYVVVGSTLLPTYALFEVTILTTLFQRIGYLFMIGVANVVYLLDFAAVGSSVPSGVDFSKIADILL